MTKDEAYDYFDEHWKDYDAIHYLLDTIFDQHEREKAQLQSTFPQATLAQSEPEELFHLKEMLQKCRDQLDEETHKR